MPKWDWKQLYNKKVLSGVDHKFAENFKIIKSKKITVVEKCLLLISKVGTISTTFLTNEIIRKKRALKI